MNVRTYIVLPVIGALVLSVSMMMFAYVSISDAHKLTERALDIDESAVAEISKFTSKLLSIAAYTHSLSHTAEQELSYRQLHEKTKALGALTDNLFKKIRAATTQFERSQYIEAEQSQLLETALSAHETLLAAAIDTSASTGVINSRKMAASIAQVYERLSVITQRLLWLNHRQTSKIMEHTRASNSMLLGFGGISISLLLALSWLVERNTSTRLKSLMDELDAIDTSVEQQPTEAKLFANEFDRLAQSVVVLRTTFSTNAEQKRQLIITQEMLQKQLEKQAAHEQELEAMTQALEVTVARRTNELSTSNEQLAAEVNIRWSAEKQLRTFELVVKNAEEAIFICDEAGCIEFVNAAFEKLTGSVAADSKGKLPRDVIHSRHETQFFDDMISRLLEYGQSSEEIYIQPQSLDAPDELLDEVPVWVKMYSLTPDVSTSRRAVGFGRDIRAIKQTEQRLRLFERAVMNTAEAVFLTDAHARITVVNAAFEKLTGCSAETAIGRRTREVVLHSHPGDYFDAMHEELAANGTATREIQIRPVRQHGQHATPQEVACLISASTMNEPSGAISGFVGFIRDISARKLYEKRLEHLAYTDSLTGLVNRVHFETLLTDEIARHRRSKQQLALLYLDLDDFKSVNDTFGHAAGDSLLKDVASRFKSTLRETDIVSRRGGDEFTILLTQLDHLAPIERLCEKLIRAVAALHGPEYGQSLGLTIGIAIFPQDSDNPEQLQIFADRAMYTAKARGKNRFEAYSSEMQQRWEARRATELALKYALDAGQLEMYYQPIVDLETRKVVAAEALLRWWHQNHFISPADFIPIAEASDLILEVDTWVLDEACRQLKQWQTKFNTSIAMHVNVSSKFIQQGNIDEVADAFTRHAIDGGSICLEITETAVIRDTNTAHNKVKALQALGSSVGLDDFGTGYSSLNHLTAFPIDLLKIDREFISKSEFDEASRIIVDSIAKMARRLGNDVIAEGVETETQLNLAKQSGCGFAQGYLLGKPVRSAMFADTHFTRSHDVPRSQPSEQHLN